MKKIIKLILSVVIIFESITISFAESPDSIIPKTRIYDSGTFVDINNSDWFYDYIISAYEYGVVSGMDNENFNPNGNMKICEAITIASRINSMVYNKTVETFSSNNDVWYSPYVNYADSNGIVAKIKFQGRYEENITRAEFVYIMANCVDTDELSNENPYFKTIPDMKPQDNYYEFILRMIKAGVISGKDEEGNFYPNDYITRAEVSTVLNRLIDRSARKSEVKHLKTPETNPYDRTEYYEENTDVLNYGNYNNIYSIYAGYINEYYESIYCYMYKEKQLNSYFDTLTKDEYKIQVASDNYLYKTYECTRKNDDKIYIRVFKEYKQIWINILWDDSFKLSTKNNSDEIKENTVLEKNAWDKSETYIENSYLKNYGQFNNIASLSRVIDTSAGMSKMKYQYTYEPAELLNYYSYLDYKNYELQTLTVDSNALFLDCTYKSRNTTVRIFVDLIKSTVTIEFPKTHNSE